MNHRFWLVSVLCGTLLLSADVAKGQEPPPSPLFGGPMELLGFGGGHGGHVVTGAPYSATAMSETTQTLTDPTTGTTIHLTTTTQSVLYRDSHGRSRREVTLSTASGKTHTLVTIADPGAGAHYVLDPEHKVARKMTLRTPGGNTMTPEAAQVFQGKMKARMQAEEASGALIKKSLGTQTINGVSAECTQITRTIRAGDIGNDTAMQVTSERCYSSALQMVVMSTRSDPRFGTTTYTVKITGTTEPDASFTIPAGYTVIEGGPGPNMRYRRGFGKGAPLAAPPAPNN